MKNILKLLFTAVFVYMCYVLISTSKESNLFSEWSYLTTIPWMKATLWDFYANVLVLYLWICYKETSWGMRAVWLVLMVCLGSIATTAYILIQLIRLTDEEGVKDLLIKRNN